MDGAVSPAVAPSFGDDDSLRNEPSFTGDIAPGRPGGGVSRLRNEPSLTGDIAPGRPGGGVSRLRNEPSLTGDIAPGRPGDGASPRGLDIERRNQAYHREEKKVRKLATPGV